MTPEDLKELRDSGMDFDVLDLLNEVERLRVERDELQRQLDIVNASDAESLLAEARADLAEKANEVARLRADLKWMGDARTSWQESSMKAQYERGEALRKLEQAEARLAEETKAQDEALALLHKQIEELEALLAKVDRLIRDVLSRPIISRDQLAEIAFTAAQPEERPHPDYPYNHPDDCEPARPKEKP